MISVFHIGLWNDLWSLSVKCPKEHWLFKKPDIAGIVEKFPTFSATRVYITLWDLRFTRPRMIYLHCLVWRHVQSRLFVQGKAGRGLGFTRAVQERKSLMLIWFCWEKKWAVSEHHLGKNSADELTLDSEMYEQCLESSNACVVKYVRARTRDPDSCVYGHL
jgi:hypothetical protein